MSIVAYRNPIEQFLWEHVYPFLAGAVILALIIWAGCALFNAIWRRFFQRKDKR